ncbi:hypothetical protein AB0G85_22355 [Streptomyces sioyaensis]|uniref:hypothetical protein n=1 Tax=Streptomyces sioyaensis TaxID=67364 RepID=UPI0033D7F882
MTTPSPAAFVRPLIIDPAGKRFLLLSACPSGAAGVTWTIPVVPVRTCESFARAATNYLQQQTGLPWPQIAPVIGRFPAGPGRQRPEYVVLAPLPSPAWPKYLPERAGRWWTTAQLRAARDVVEPAILPDFIDGYWDGWLPDGEISLE